MLICISHVGNYTLQNMNKAHYTEYIGINPEIRFGKPCVKGTRITVYDVLGYFANGMSEAEILADFPQLSQEAVSACLSFAADKGNQVKFT
jgi:uncharacterized protein (DUF433 family)